MFVVASVEMTDAETLSMPFTSQETSAVAGGSVMTAEVSCDVNSRLDSVSALVISTLATTNTTPPPATAKVSCDVNSRIDSVSASDVAANAAGAKDTKSARARAAVGEPMPDRGGAAVLAGHCDWPARSN